MNAATRVEDHDDVDRQLLDIQLVDGLAHAVVEQFEVSGGEAGDHLPIVGDEHVDADQLGGRPEPLRSLRDRGDLEQHDPHRRHQPRHRRTSVRSPSSRASKCHQSPARYNHHGSSLPSCWSSEMTISAASADRPRR